MVLPLVDEDKPKCFLCHDTFDDYEDLREHQETKHKEASAIAKRGLSFSAAS